MLIDLLVSARWRVATNALLMLVASGVADVSAAQTWAPLGEPGAGGQLTGLVVSPHDPNRVLVSGDMLGIGLSTDGGESWGSTSGFLSWEMASMTWHPTDPDIVWAGSMGGAYVSNDAGLTWESSRNGFPAFQNFRYSVPIEKVLFDPNNSGRLVAVGGSNRRWDASPDTDFGTVWESTDSGQNWTQLTTVTSSGSSTASGANGINIVDAEFATGSSTVMYAAVDNQGFYRSTDGGQSWSKSNSGLPHTRANRVVADPLDGDTVYLALGSNGTNPGGIFKSINGGDSWFAANSGLPQVSGGGQSTTSRFQGLDIAEDGSGVLYTGDYRFGSQHSVARSANNGTSWSSVLTSSQPDTYDPAGSNMTVIAVDPNDPNRVFAAGSAFVLRTENGGQSWEDVTSDPVAGNRYRGNGFTGWVSTAIEFNPHDNDHVIIQAWDAARVLQTKDGGQSWSHEATSTSSFGGGRDVVFAGPQTIYATIGQREFRGVARSTDGGDSWTVLHGGTLPALNTGSAPYGVYSSPNDPTEVWASINGNLLRSTNSGGSWSTALSANNIRWIEEDPNNPDTFYVSAENNVYRTTNGTSFQSIGGPGEPGRMTVDSNGDLLLASHDGSGSPGNGVWRYDGSSWSQIFDDDYAVDVAVDPNNPLRIAVTTDDDPFRDVSRGTGVYLTEDGGVTWTSVNDGLPMLRAQVITFNPENPNELLLGTTGRGFFRIRLDLPGDFNGDGAVDAADFTLWRDTEGQTGFGLPADHDASGEVDQGDYEIWRQNFGSQANSAVSVPEAGALTSVWLGVVSAASWRAARL